ncbi:MAG: glycosyltransferase family 2 protein, partial [Candidatus Izemoplasmatales bacterium]|nr:glycosyltransferase family 2 protein [Candidatus Izemoplasmatales bacterium]
TNLNYRVDFIAKAHCHTEVPQSIKTFFRQRNRWQRGLVDILSYHRKMIMNPKYKQVGLFAMSYFYVFEMIGPLFEVQAYLAIFAGIFFGILNTEILLLLFVVTVLLGIVLSLFSLMISEDEHEQYSVKEIWVMIGIAILENFGWRQLISLQRAYGFLLSLRENQAWGQMNRVGFRQGNKK